MLHPELSINLVACELSINVVVLRYSKESIYGSLPPCRHMDARCWVRQASGDSWPDTFPTYSAELVGVAIRGSDACPKCKE
eukprot:scaffold47725_cov28-Tisochrysis_lutea.AAC.6